MSVGLHDAFTNGLRGLCPKQEPCSRVKSSAYDYDQAPCVNSIDTNLRVSALALIATIYGVPRLAPGLLAWIDGAAEWPVTVADHDRPEMA